MQRQVQVSLFFIRVDDAVLVCLAWQSNDGCFTASPTLLWAWQKLARSDLVTVCQHAALMTRLRTLREEI